MDIFDLSMKQTDSGIINSGTKRITVYNTHIEVYPYKRGECRDLEKALSTYIFTRKIYKPFAFKIIDNTLFLPKGMNIGGLEIRFQSTVNYEKKSDPSEDFRFYINMKVRPRDEIQALSIDFLTSTGKFSTYSKNTQRILTLNTGYGKTYCAIAAMTYFHKKTIIFIHRTTIEEQWIEYIKEYTNIDPSRICLLNSMTQLDALKKKELDYDIFISSHQLFALYAGKNGWSEVREIFKNSGIGIKIFDEAHLYMENLLSLDFHSNTFLTYYLTATLERTDKRENQITKLIFSSAYKWGERASRLNQNLIYIPVFYNSGATMYENTWIKKNGMFSAHRFIEYAIKSNSSFYLRRALECILEDIKQRGIYGQRLIVTPKIESVDAISNFLKENVENPDEVATIYSKNSKEVNLENRSSKWISSTIKSTGVGFSPPELQCLICIDPISSSIFFKQLIGRLDRFKPGEPTYFYELLDLSLDDIMRYYNTTHLPVMETIAKEIIPIKVGV